MSSQREAEYKQGWIRQHDKADELLCDAETKEPVAAIYYYAPTAHKAHMERLWKLIGEYMYIKRLEEMDNEL